MGRVWLGSAAALLVVGTVPAPGGAGLLDSMAVGLGVPLSDVGRMALVGVGLLMLGSSVLRRVRRRPRPEPSAQKAT